MPYTTFEPGDPVGPYKIEKLLGAGNFGRTFKATGPSGAVAVKQLTKTASNDLSSAAIARSMKAEAEILKHVKGDNVVRFIELLEVQSVPLLVMEFINGKPLSELVASRRLEKNQWLNIAQQLISGLESIHKKGIVHRDLHLNNILLDAYDKVKITDFGIAQGASKISECSSLAPDPRIGAELILAPELRAGKATPSSCTDLYSLGIVLHVMATGVRPGADEFSIIAGETVTLHTIRPDLPLEWCDAVDWLSRDAESRPTSTSELANAIKSCDIPFLEWKGVKVDRYLEVLAKLLKRGIELGLEYLKGYSIEWPPTPRRALADFRVRLPLSRGFQRAIKEKWGKNEGLLLSPQLVRLASEARTKKSPDALALGVAVLDDDYRSGWYRMLNDHSTNVHCKKDLYELYRVINALSRYMWEPPGTEEEEDMSMFLPRQMLSSIVADYVGDKRVTMEVIKVKKDGQMTNTWKPAESFTKGMWNRWQARWIGESYIAAKSFYQTAKSITSK